MKTVHAVSILLALIVGVLLCPAMPLHADGANSPVPTSTDPGDSDPMSPEELNNKFGPNAQLAVQLHAQGYSWGSIGQAIQLAENREITPEEILLLGETYPWGNVKQAVSLADQSKLTVAEIAALRDTYKWGTVRQAVRMEGQCELDAAQVLELRATYGWRRLKKAVRTASKTGESIEAILAAQEPSLGARLKAKFGFGKKSEGTAGDLGDDAVSSATEKNVEKAAKSAQQMENKAERKAEQMQEKAERAAEKAEGKAERDAAKADKKANKNKGGKHGD